jgi:hypothetical protein
MNLMHFLPFVVRGYSFFFRNIIRYPLSIIIIYLQSYHIIIIIID